MALALDPTELIGHWGYLAIVAFVAAGTAGLPAPEESVLVAAGYLAWRGALRLPVAIAVGVVSAVAGDNLGYWVGRRYGRGVLERYGRHVFITAARLEAAVRFITHHGAAAIFAARFLPGLRSWAGPLAGAVGMPYQRFFIANVLGAVCYVPLAVLAGYAVGYGLGHRFERVRESLGGLEHWLLGLALVGTAALLAWRFTRARAVRS